MVSTPSPNRPPVPRPPEASEMHQSNYRWVICALLFFATTINYVDRQILSLLKPILDNELHWTNAEFGWINALFQGAYAFSYLFFGWFIDRYGIKIGYAVSIAAWSLAAAAHAMANTIGGFALARVALGLGEGGNFPGAIKAVSVWFAKKDRVLATTLFNSGSNVGALIAPALVPPFALAYGWHAAFLAAGVAGFVWLIAWFIYFRDPTEKALAATGPGGAPAASEPKLPWKALLRYRQTWAFVGAKFLTDPVWWFLLIWLPDYFKKTRGLDLKTMGLPLVVIYAVVTVLSIACGVLTSRLAGRFTSLTSLRRAALLTFACTVVPIGFIGHFNLWTAVIVIGIAGAAHQAWSATLMTTVSDVFPKSAVASVIGLGGFIGSFGGMLFPVICGMVLDAFTKSGNVTQGYGVLFTCASLAYIIAYALNRYLCPSFAPMAEIPAPVAAPSR